MNRRPQLIPTTIERPGEPIDPVERRVMRGMHRRGREITEPRTMRSARSLPVNPLDRAIRQILIQVIAVTADMRSDRRRLVVDRRLPTARPPRR